MFKRFVLTGIVVFCLWGVSFSQVAFPLKFSSDKRYLVDQNNKPFPILGRTAWFLVSQSEAGYKTFLDNTIKHGFNSIEISVIYTLANGQSCAVQC